MEVIPELFMTDTKFKKALTIAEIAKMKPEEALQYNLNRMEYIEIKGVADASFTDGQQASDAKWQPLLEQERKEKEQAEKRAEQERERTIAMLRNFIEAGFSKEKVAEINKMTMAELEELLGQ